MIERFYVNNFRCLENFSIDLGGRSSALLIGKNGSGKSTLQEALRVFQRISRGSNRVGDLVKRSDFTQQRTHIPMRFEADLALAEQRFRYAISFEMPEDVREARVAEEELSVDGDIVFRREQSRVSLEGGSDFGLDWRLPALPIIKERQREGSIDLIKKYFASMILIAPIPASMSGFAEDETEELEKYAENFASCFNSLLLQHPAAYGVLFEYLAAVMPDLESFENVRRGAQGTQLRVKFQAEDEKRRLSVDFNQLSDGEKCFFLSALIVASSRVGRSVFCMWDEPDNHLSLHEIGHFVMQLRKSMSGKSQFIATSHHPETIRAFSDENTLVFKRESHLEPTVVRQLGDLGYRGDLVEALVRGEVLD